MDLVIRKDNWTVNKGMDETMCENLLKEKERQRGRTLWRQLGLAGQGYMGPIQIKFQDEVKAAGQVRKIISWKYKKESRDPAGSLKYGF